MTIDVHIMIICMPMINTWCTFIVTLIKKTFFLRCGPDANLVVGTRVAIENHFYCGKCYQCTHDRPDICKQMNQYGHGRGTPHGGCCQYSIVSQKYCFVITADISESLRVSTGVTECTEWDTDTTKNTEEAFLQEEIFLEYW